MSPKNRKKRVRVRSPGRPQLPSSGNTIMFDLPDSGVDRAKASHHVRLRAALAVLGASNLLAEISAESHPNIAADGSADTPGGLQAPFAQGSYDVSIRKNSEYTAGINIF